MGTFGAEECTDLWGVYTALKNGQAKVEDYFQTKEEVPDPFAKTGETKEFSKKEAIEKEAGSELSSLWEQTSP